MLIEVPFEFHCLRTFVDGEEPHARVTSRDQEFCIVQESDPGDFATRAEATMPVATVDA